jgi:hypothetical protein
LQNNINTEFPLLRVEINLSEGFICNVVVAPSGRVVLFRDF